MNCSHAPAVGRRLGFHWSAILAITCWRPSSRSQANPSFCALPQALDAQQGRLGLAVTAKVVGLGQAAIPTGLLLVGEMAQRCCAAYGVGNGESGFDLHYTFALRPAGAGCHQ